MVSGGRFRKCIAPMPGTFTRGCGGPATFGRGGLAVCRWTKTHLAAALRYVALNPVRARLVKRALDWRWSSVHDQLSRKRRGTLTDTAPVRERYANFAALIEAGEDEDLSTALHRAETIGRPLGDAAFVKKLERQTGRILRPAKRGPKPQQAREPERRDYQLNTLSL